MELGLAGQVAVVTGANRGIGLAVARGFLDEGASVVAGVRRSSAELDELAARGQLRIVSVDLADPAGPDQLIDAAGDRIDVLVNNVGAAPTRLDGFLSITDQMWQETLNLDLMSAVRTIRAALPVMLAAGHGVIVDIGSLNARLPDPAVLDYSAAKSALVSVGKSLSKEFGPRGIRVNTVDPGPVATDLWLGDGGVAATVAAASGQDAKEVAAEAAAGMVTGRFTRPDEVADLVLLLASGRTANVTGADFVIDGGMVTTIP
jgi:NAD(P)-dependent dehydrogenase (short-subunit alcohol dehydrogenase family)